MSKPVQSIQQLVAKAKKLADAEYAASKETREALAKDLGETQMVSGDQEWIANQFTKKEALSSKIQAKMKEEARLLDAPFWKTILNGNITGKKLYRKLGDLLGKDFKLYEKAAEKTVPVLERRELTKHVDEIKAVPAAYTQPTYNPNTGAIETRIIPGTGSSGPTPVKGVQGTHEYDIYGGTHSIPNPLNSSVFGSRAGQPTLGGEISGGLGSVAKTALVAPFANWALNNENNPDWSVQGVASKIFKDKNDKTKTLEEHLRTNPMANTALKNAEEKINKKRSDSLTFNGYTERDGKLYTGDYNKNPELFDTHFGAKRNRVSGTLFKHYMKKGLLNPETSAQYLAAVQRAFDEGTPEAAEKLGQAMIRKFQSINVDDKKAVTDIVFPLPGIQKGTINNSQGDRMVLIYDPENKKYELKEVYKDGAETNI